MDSIGLATGGIVLGALLLLIAMSWLFQGSTSF